ncbi:MAG: DUF3180 domain-containing protein [Micrococcus sp.]|nr:DUF3180 domain-containing protein [Micrococcus sp.]
MISLRTWWLPGLGVAAMAVGWIAAVFFQDSGWPTPSLGLSGVTTTTALSLVCLLFGLRIRRDRDRPVAARMDPVAAARVLVLAQAAGFAGALIGGWHAGVLVQVLSRSADGAPVLSSVLWMLAASLVLVAVGLLVETWCRIPPAEEGGEPGSRQNGGRDGRPPHAEEPGREPGTQGGYARART